MLERGVEVRLLAEVHHAVKVRVVHVGVDAEEPFQDGFDDGEEVFRKGHANLEEEK